MKKIICVVVIAVFVIASAIASFAQYSSAEGSNKPDEQMMKKKMAGKGMMGHGMMAKSGMVATPDGGVIVMAGNKLYKYDKNLNLVKEAEVKVDVEGMQKMMAQMKEKCRSMCDKTGKQPAEATNP